MTPESTAHLIKAMLDHSVKSLSPQTLTLLTVTRSSVEEFASAHSLPDDQRKIAETYIAALSVVINFTSLHFVVSGLRARYSVTRGS